MMNMPKAKVEKFRKLMGLNKKKRRNSGAGEQNFSRLNLSVPVLRISRFGVKKLFFTQELIAPPFL